MPLTFTENVGQWDGQVRFCADAPGARIWFAADGVYYHIVSRSPKNDPVVGGPMAADPRCVRQHVIKASFVGANPHPEIVGADPATHRRNYFIGCDPEKWYTDVPAYGAVVLRDVYEGIDLKYYGGRGLMEYDFILSPGADPSKIEVRYDGAGSLNVDPDGRLVIEMDWCTVVEMAPLVYQECDGDRLELQSSYILLSTNSFGFRIEEEYDNEYALIIDPVLTYGTYLGGSLSELAHDIAVDGLGNIIIAGITYSTDFPVENEYQSDQPQADFFVAKFTNSGDDLLYSTYIGGGDTDNGFGLDADALGNAYVTGLSASADFPTVNPYQTDQPGHDAVVAKLNAAGNDLIFSTYLGGMGSDYSGGIAVGPGDEVYVTGHTNSPDFPILNSYDTAVTSYEVYVTKFNSSGTALIYSSIVSGTTYRDIPLDIVVDNLGCAYIAGTTESSDYPTVNAVQTDQAGWDGFITKFTAAGSDLVYSTYLGGNGYDELAGITLHQNSEAYVTGYTASTDFPTFNEYQSDLPGEDAVVARFEAIGQLVYCTYLGGNDSDRGVGVAVDSVGNAFVTGWTQSADFPVLDPFDPENDDVAIFVTKFTAAGSSLHWSTFAGDGNGYDIRLDRFGYANVSGASSDLGIELPGAYDSTPNGQADAIFLKIEEDGYIVGDADGSGTVDIDDVVFLIAYIFSGGPEPVPYEAGDADCSGTIDIDDVVYLIAYIFSGGPEPGDPDGDGVPDC
jgi:hypothetical protein